MDLKVAIQNIEQSIPMVKLSGTYQEINQIISALHESMNTIKAALPKEPEVLPPEK